MSDDLTPDYNPGDLLDQVLAKKDDELIPWQSITLPSKGHYYDGQIPNGVVKIKPMGLYADKVLATSRLIKTGQAMDYIFKHCVRMPNDFDPLDLLSDDRVFLLYILRGVTHGNDYEFILNCPSCDNHSQHEYDLNELWETRQEPPVDSNDLPLQEPFKIVLPYLSQQVGDDFWVTVRFLRGRDTMDFLGTVSHDAGLPGKARNRKNRGKKPVYDPIGETSENVDEALENNINRVIVSAMGVEDRDKIGKLVEKMHSEDIGTISEWLRLNSPGIDTSIETDCPHCKAVINAPLPITESFFRPKKRRGSRE